jgi:hypothetical protein
MVSEIKNVNQNAQHLTSGIKHWGLSGYVSVLPRIKFGVTRQVSSPQSPTFHTASRYVQFNRDDQQ